MATLPTLTACDPNLIPNKATMTDEEFADAIHPYLNFWNGTTIPEINNWSPILEQIRQEINDKYIAVKNQAIDGGYSQAYLDTKYNPPMGRTYYVDAVNGDDTNDGSSGSPFKTLKKAIDSVPVGGYGKIYLSDDKVYYIEAFSLSYLYNKKIKIVRKSDGTNKPEIRIKSAVRSANYFSIFQGIDYYVQLVAVKITDEISDSSLGISVWGIFGRESNGTITIEFLYCDINMQNAKLVSTANDVVKLNVRFKYSNCIFVPQTQISLDYSATASISNHSSTFEDGNGNSLGLNDFVSGIVKDADGKPRNILSNIVL